jgi:thiol:disulfide interchange protein DsbD
VLFCVGLIITFTVLGVAMGPVIQELANSLALNLFLFLLMVVLALSLLGMFDIQLPSSWTTKLQAAGSGASILAPVFMGVAFSLASFSCTVGVIGPVLAASTENVGAATSNMFSYSLGFALPFFVLALFPVAVSAMPRSGGWLNTVKVMLGFFEVCFAGYYLWKLDLNLGWGIGTWPIILSLWAMTFLVAGIYLLGKLRLPKDDPVETVGVPRALTAILCFTFALFLFAGLMGRVRLPPWMSGLLPPETGVIAAGAGGGGGSEGLASGIVALPKPAWADETFHPAYGGDWWSNDRERALEIGKREGRRVFLNFTGIFCTNCRTMEKGLFLDPEVQAEFAEMILVDLYTDVPKNRPDLEKLKRTTRARSEANNELRSRRREDGGYHTTKNPYYVIHAPDGRILAESGYQPDREKFLRFLRTGRNGKQ